MPPKNSDKSAKGDLGMSYICVYFTSSSKFLTKTE